MSRIIEATLRFKDQFTNPMNTAVKKMQANARKIKSVGREIERAGQGISELGTKMTLGITAPVALAGASMVNAASDYQENLNKIDVAFGKSCDSVKKWGDTALRQFGLSKNQALESAALYGDMGTSMGFSKGKAAEMSTELAGLAGDMASFKNIGADQAMTALNSVYTGETESLKMLGVVMTQQNLNEFARQRGIKKTVQQMSQSEQVQLRYNYVLAKTKNAQGDYARTADGTANSLRTFQGSVENLKIAFGERLLPTLTPIVNKLTAIVDKFTALSPKTQTLILKIAGIAAVTGPALKVFGGLVTTVGKTTGAIGKLNMIIAKHRAAAPATNKALEFIKKGYMRLAAEIRVAGSAHVLFQNTTKSMKRVSTNAIGSIIGFAKRGGGAILGLGASMGAAILPILPIIAIIGVVSASLIYLWKTDKGFRNSIKQSTKEIKSALMPILQELSKTFKSVIKALKPVVTTLLQSLAPAIKSILKNIAPFIESIAPSVISIIKVITKIIKLLAPVLQFVVKIIGFFAAAWLKMVAKVLTVVTNLHKTVPAKIKKIGNSLKEIGGGIKGWFTDKIGKATSTTKKYFSLMEKHCGKSTKGMKGVLGGLTKFISGTFTGNWSKAWGGVRQIFGSIFNSLADMCKKPMNAVIKLINNAISGINSISVDIPDIPGLPGGGSTLGFNIPTIPKLAKGTTNFRGGMAIVGEEGPELVNLPKGSQVNTNRDSKKMATRKFVLSKLADTIVVREDADIDKIVEKLVSKLEMLEPDMA